MTETRKNLVFLVQSSPDPQTVEALVDEDLWTTRGFGVVVESTWPLGKLGRKAASVAEVESSLVERESCRLCIESCQRPDLASPQCDGAIPDVAWVPYYWRRRLRELGTAVLVVGSEVLPEGRAAVLAARSLGIPSVQLQHGIAGGWWGYAPSLSSRVLSWGPDSTERLRSFGISHEAISEIGSPRADALRVDVSALAKSSGRIRDQLGLPHDATVVTLAEGFRALPASTLDRIVHLVDSVMRLSSDVWFLVKTHPAERIDFVRGLFAEAANTSAGRLVVCETGMAEALCVSDLVLVVESTVGLEAAAAGRYIVGLDIGLGLPSPPRGGDGIPTVADASQLLSFIAEPQLVTGDYLRRQFGSNLGRARAGFFQEVLALATDQTIRSPEPEMEKLFGLARCDACTPTGRRYRRLHRRLASGLRRLRRVLLRRAA